MALNDVAALVELFVEDRWAPAGEAIVLPGVLFVGFLWDHCLDAAASEAVTNDPVGVGPYPKSPRQVASRAFLP